MNIQNIGRIEKRMRVIKKIILILILFLNYIGFTEECLDNKISIRQIINTSCPGWLRNDYTRYIDFNVPNDPVNALRYNIITNELARYQDLHETCMPIDKLQNLVNDLNSRDITQLKNYKKSEIYSGIFCIVLVIIAQLPLLSFSFVHNAVKRKGVNKNDSR